MRGNEARERAGMHEKPGLSHRPTFRKNYLQPALEAGLIERTLPDKPDNRLQKYRRRGACGEGGLSSSRDIAADKPADL